MRLIKVILSSLLILTIFTGCNLPKAAETIQGPDLNLILTDLAATNNVLTPKAPTDTLPPNTPTPDPKKVLNVCLGKEPNTLFFYAGSSQAMWTVLEAIYDGPFDRGNGENVPVIFDSIDVQTNPATVKTGMVLLDASGAIVAASDKTDVVPYDAESICGSAGCTIAWDTAKTDITIPQTTITFHLKPGLQWSDGEPMTAKDSVYSKELNGNRNIKAAKTQINLTETYMADDDQTVTWKGIPGYVPEDPSDVFWFPLPAHQMEAMDAESILASDQINHYPVGWGAYQISQWVIGDHISLTRNPYYKLSDGNQPWFDEIVFKFFGEPGDNNKQALLSSACDIIDTSVDLQADLEPSLEDVRDGKFTIYIQPELSWEQITFGIDSLAENRLTGGRNLFSDESVRNAIAQCIDRKGIIRNVFYGQSEIPNGFYPAGYSKNDETISAIAYNPEAGSAALEAAGWLDNDSDASTPRIAANVAGVTAGTPFDITLSTTLSAFRQKAAEQVKADLAVCGIGVTIDTQPLTSLYGKGPEGILFGRKFDLAQFAWSSDGQPACKRFTTAQIPTAENNWIGANVGGFSDSEFDTLCSQSMNDVQNSAITSSAVQQAFTEKLPVIPLYFNFSVGASANTICGIEDKIGSRSILWNIERLSRSDSNCAVSQWNNIYEE